VHADCVEHEAGELGAAGTGGDAAVRALVHVTHDSLRHCVCSCLHIVRKPAALARLRGRLCKGPAWTCNSVRRARAVAQAGGREQHRRGCRDRRGAVAVVVRVCAAAHGRAQRAGHAVRLRHARHPALPGAPRIAPAARWALVGAPSRRVCTALQPALNVGTDARRVCTALQPALNIGTDARRHCSNTSSMMRVTVRTK